MNLLFLRIIILIIFCAVGFLVGNRVSDKPAVSKKGITSVTEECKDKGICPMPKDWEEKK